MIRAAALGLQLISRRRRRQRPVGDSPTDHQPLTVNLLAAHAEPVHQQAAAAAAAAAEQERSSGESLTEAAAAAAAQVSKAARRRRRIATHTETRLSNLSSQSSRALRERQL